MEMAVWELPHDVQGRPELPELLEVINNFWKEHQLAKLAIPEVSLLLFITSSIQNVNISSHQLTDTTPRFSNTHQA